MEITTFLAQLWGPVILAIGVGIYVSRAFYTRIYTGLEKGSFSMLLFGMMTMTVGIVHVVYHNIWETLPQIVISLLGWGTLLKGVSFIILPDWVSMIGARLANMKFVPYAGVIMLLLGGYLTWFAYLI